MECKAANMPLNLALTSPDEDQRRDVCVLDLTRQTCAGSDVVAVVTHRVGRLDADDLRSVVGA
jgi:hypothetical protein